MKKILLGIVCIMLTFNMVSQTYTPFPTSNAYWSAMQCEPGPFVPKSAFVKVGVFGDTLINDLSYNKLYLQGKFTNSFLCDTCGFSFDMDDLDSTYFMSYREEDKVIYFVPQQNSFGDPDGTEYPIFDFNISTVGETVTGYENIFLPYNYAYGYGSLEDTEELIVESIDSVQMSDGSFRRRINFEALTYGLQESWIEGIGSTKGFGFSLNVTNMYNSMICFSNNEISLESPEIRSQQNCTSTPGLNFPNQCENTIANSIIDFDNSNDVNAFPNPFATTFSLTGIEMNDIVVIYDILNREIYRNVATSTSMEVSLSTFESGAYFCTISNALKDKIILKKLIKE